MLLYTRSISRIAQTRPCRTRWRCTTVRCYGSSPEAGDDAPWFPELRREMLDRPAVSFHECVNFDTDRKLIDTLSTFLPPRWCGRLHRGRSRVPMGHSLLWFNTSMPVDQLLPDGTDPLQSPGGPWVRRMWAGGNMQLRQEEYHHKQRGFAIDSDMVCAERIKDVQLRGQGDAAKIFVTLERRYTRWETLQKHLRPGLPSARSLDADTEAIFQQQLLNEDWGDAVLKEERDLVFLKEKTPAEFEAIKAGQLAPIKYLEAPKNPDFFHTLTPTRSLLFRYSALTLNAHLIHLDRDYARNVEGHRDLLVHGPLALTLLLQVMTGHVNAKTDGRNIVESIRYRNLAPLYCDEPMRICGSIKKSFVDGELYDVWIEGPTGGVAVKGTVRTVVRRPVRGDIDAKMPAVTRATNLVADKKPRRPRIHMVTTDKGPLVPATSVDRLKGSKRVEILSSIANETDTPASGDRPTPNTAEDTGASVRQSARLLAKATPNLRPRNRVQQEFEFRTLISPKLMLSKFAIPPIPSPSFGTEQSSAVEDASRTASKQPATVTTQELPCKNRHKSRERVVSKQVESIVIRRTEAPASPMLRKVSYRTRQLLSRVARTPHVEVTPKTNLVRKYAGTPYTYNPTDLARRHSRYQRRSARKVTNAHARKITIASVSKGRDRVSKKPRSSVWQRL